MTNTPNFNAIADKIAAKRQEINALMQQFNSKLQAEFTTATQFFFEETGIQAVIWNQYTPAFNDGEPCTFTLGDAVFITKNFDSEDLMSADNYEDDETYGTIPYGWSAKKNPHQLTNACDSFNSLLSSIEEILESMFGDGYGTTVYLTKDEVFTAEYDCGY